VGNPLFGVNISKLIADNMDGQLLPAILHTVTPGTPTGNLTGGTNPTEVDTACQGFIDTQNRESIGGTLVRDGDIVIVLIGDLIASGTVAPTTADKVTIEGAKYNIKKLDRDPAAAAYTLICRSL